jgi:tRNA threonylcarbamoyladenosine biosynthesis protein TsaE
MIFESASVEQTKQIAADIVGQLQGGETLLLEGDLGSGKTTFVQGLADALKADHARSPTFSIMNVYQTNHSKIRELVHLDFYRMKNPRELAELGLEEWLGRKDAVVVIEWPGVVADAAFKNPIRVQLSVVNASERRIDISFGNR